MSMRMYTVKYNLLGRKTKAVPGRNRVFPLKTIAFVTRQALSSVADSHF